MRKPFIILVLLALLLSACSPSRSNLSMTPSPGNIQRQVDPFTSTPADTLTARAEPTTTALPTDPTATEPLSDPTATVAVAIQMTLTQPEDLTRTDQQGAVEVVITPVNLTSAGETLDFEVALNTHSVNLNMNLAKLATLTTDSGKRVAASSWKGGEGGHHVSGTLSFPASVDGTPLLEGAKELTLTLLNVDAPERTFKWAIHP